MKYNLLALLLCLPLAFFAQNQDSLAVVWKVDSLLDKANERWKSKKYEEALPFAQEAADMSKQKWGENNARHAAALQRMAQIHNVLRQYDKAEGLYLKAIEIRAKVLGKERPPYVSSLNTLAYMYWEIGEYSKAIPLYLEAKTIREKNLGKDHLDYIASVENLASVYFFNGDYDKAKPLYKELIACREKTVGKEHIAYATPLNTLGVLYLHTGDYNKAEPMLLEAIEIKAKVVGEKHPDYATSLDNFASLHWHKGNYDRAEQLFLKAKQIRAETVGEEHPQYAASLNNLAILYMDKGDFDKAESLLSEGLEIKRKTAGPEHPEFARYLNNLAGFYKDKDKSDYDKAESMYLEALKIREKILGKEHPDYAVSLANLATLYLKKGDYEKADTLLKKAIKIQEKVLGKEHPDYAASLNNLAIVYQETDRIHQASEIFLDLNGLYRHLIEESATYSSENQMLAYLQFYEDEIAQFHHFTQEYPQPALTKASFDNALFYNGLLLENYSRLFRLAAEADAPVREAFDQWQDYRRSLVREKAKPITERNTTHIAEWEDKAETLEKELVRDMAGYADLTRQTNWRDIQQKLAPGLAAIEFISYHHYTGKKNDSTLYAALVLLPTDSAPHFIPLFEERQLQILFNRPGFDEQLTIKGLYASNSELLNLLWKPLEPLLRDVKTIYYAPSGLLHRINPAALRDADKQPLSAGRQWVRVGGMRELVAGRSADRSFARDPAAPSSASVWGGIRYDMDSLAFAAANPLDPAAEPLSEFRRKTGDEGWKPLTGSALEAEQIAELLQKTGFRTEVLSGYAASEERFKTIGQTTPSPRILHVATHGFAYPDPKKESQRSFIEQKPVYKLQDDPMLRSGLILAGANHYWETHRPLQNRDDGVLVAYEVRDLNLRNTELAVLSACQTGSGEVVGSEGVYGLQRAFRIAGAKFLIVSLWQVPDEQTRKLMRLFYENWVDKRESLRDAFNHAQATLREREPNPYMWAGFVLIE